MSKATRSQFLRIFVIIGVFIICTVLTYQRIFGGSAHNDVQLIDGGIFHFKSTSDETKSTAEEIGKSIENSPSFREMQMTNKDDELLLKEINSFSQRTTSFLKWINEMKPKQTANGFPLIRWDLISNAEIHIVHKLCAYLKKALNSPQSKVALKTLVEKGYQCTASQATQQELISKRISMDICSEIEWYKVVHLAWPEARSFMDIGANKGYLGSLFVALWGGGGLNVSPATIFDLSKRLKSWKDSRNPAGYCKDGFSYGIPLYCPTQRSEETGQCDVVNEDMRVVSIDGSSYLKNTLSSMITNELSSPSKGRVSGMWRYLNFAMSDQKGSVRFTKQDANNNAGFEGGSIKGSSDVSTTEEVNMTSVDLFMRETGLTHIDLLKIDTEGNDNKVLVGAKEAIEKHLGMFTFEGGKGVTLSADMIKEYDSLGFSCYSTSRAGLFKWNGGCMKEQYMGGFSAKDKGNIFCVSRRRAPMATLAYDILSFPMMIDEYLESDRADDSIRKKLRTDIESAEANEKINPSDLVPIYINIKPFCSPWPACV